MKLCYFSAAKMTTVNMENISATFDAMVNSFTDADDLMNFAATWGIQDSPAVRFRLFQLRNVEYGDEFVNDELDGILKNLVGPLNATDEDLEMALEYVNEQDEVEGSIKGTVI